MTKKAIHSDPEILGGILVFVGTRVPVSFMFDYLHAGESLDTFLDQYPSVSREAACVTLKTAQQLVLDDAYPA